MVEDPEGEDLVISIAAGWKAHNLQFFGRPLRT